MILVQGCSFTEGQGLDHPDKFAWPVLLKQRLKKDIVSLAEGGKDNFVMHRELVTYLMWASRGKARMPEAIVWQTTDHRRASYYRLDASGLTLPNDLESQTTKYVMRHAWHQSRGKPTGAIPPELVHRDDNREIVTVQELGDNTDIQFELQHCANIITLQTLCKSLGVRLIILNYNGNLSAMKGDPLFESINRSNYVVYNSRYHGVFNHMINMGFERFPCWHFDMDAHYYQSDIVADFFLHNTQVTVLENMIRRENISIFDYVSDND